MCDGVAGEACAVATRCACCVSGGGFGGCGGHVYAAPKPDGGVFVIYRCLRCHRWHVADSPG